MTEEEERRRLQSETNFNYLRHCMDEIHACIGKNYIGTWQQRAEKTVEEARKIREIREAVMEIEIGKRYLIRERKTSQPVFEGRVIEISPDTKYLKWKFEYGVTGANSWYEAEHFDVVCVLEQNQ